VNLKFRNGKDDEGLASTPDGKSSRMLDHHHNEKRRTQEAAHHHFGVAYSTSFQTVERAH